MIFEKVRYNKIHELIQVKEVPLLLVIIISSIILTFYKPNYLVFGNIHSIFLGASFEAILAIGMTLLLVMGGIDLSIGSLAGITGVSSGICLGYGLPIWIAVIVGILTSSFFGFLNGVIIAKLGATPMIVTLAMQMIVRGIIYVVTKGVGQPNFPDAYNILGRYTVLKIQSPIIVSIFMMVIFGLLFSKSAWFRQFYFIGGNEESSRMSGIKVDQLRIFGYTFMGFMSGVSGVLLAGRMGGAIPTQGQNMEMNVIAGCVIGGCSMAGGEGSMFGAFLGILLMSIVTNAFNILGVDIYWQRMILGLILLVSVLTDVVRRRKLN